MHFFCPTSVCGCVGVFDRHSLSAILPCCLICLQEAGGMSVCGRKALTLLSSVFAVCGLSLLGIAVSTDYWLYLEEGIILPFNQSTSIYTYLHSGLWRLCFLTGEEYHLIKCTEFHKLKTVLSCVPECKSVCFARMRIFK